MRNIKTRKTYLMIGTIIMVTLCAAITISTINQANEIIDYNNQINPTPQPTESRYPDRNNWNATPESTPVPDPTSEPVPTTDPSMGYTVPKFKDDKYSYYYGQIIENTPQPAPTPITTPKPPPQ